MVDVTKTTTTPAPAGSKVLTEQQSDMSFSVDVDRATGGAAGEARETNNDAASHSFDQEALGKELEGTLEGETSKAEGEKTGDAPEAEAPAPELGEWKRDDAETQAKYDGHYYKEGKLNKDALSTEFWTNYNKDATKGGLNEHTYKYLEDTLGISKDAIKDIEAGLVANAVQSNAKIVERVGGAELYKQATEWGKTGGYTPAQRQRFNDALARGGDDRDDAIDLLMTRFKAANPSATGAPRRGPPQERRRSSPERVVSGNADAGTAGAPSYKSAAEYGDAFRKAIDAERDAKTPQARREAKAEVEKVRAAGRRSRFA